MKPRSSAPLIVVAFSVIAGAALCAQTVNFSGCPQVDAYHACLIIDVATPMSVDSTSGLVNKWQYLPRVRVRVNSRSWQTADARGRLIVTVSKGADVTVRTDASNLMVGINDAQGTPQPHRYVDLAHTWRVNQNARQLFLLKVNPNVAK